MLTETMDVQAFANEALAGATPGFIAEAETPAMTTPVTVSVAQYVIQGSTICLIC